MGYLHGDMAVVAEVEAVQRFVPVTVLLVIVGYQSAQPCRDAQPGRQRSVVELYPTLPSNNLAQTTQH